MIFIEKLHQLFDKYNGQQCGTRDQAVLYGVYDSTPPLAAHIVFNPMPKGVMEDLICDYKYAIPQELLMLYSVMNGADLFWSVRVIGKKKTRIPFSYLSIYGSPLTCDRKHLEPFNICIEDLSRPGGTPDKWLKFGAYYRPENTQNRLDLFVDTETNRVFAVSHDYEECCVAETWDTIDHCLCCIFDLLSGGQKTEDGSLS